MRGLWRRPASVAAASPTSASQNRFERASSYSRAAPGSAAAAVSVTAGSGS